MSLRSDVPSTVIDARIASPRWRSPRALVAALFAGVVALLLVGVLDGTSDASGGTVTVSGVVLDVPATEGTAGSPLNGASVIAWYLDEGEIGWRTSDGLNEVTPSDESSDGTFSIKIQNEDIQPGRHWVLVAIPQPAQDESGVPTRGLQMFSAVGLEGAAAGSSVDVGNLQLLEPDVMGRVLDRVRDGVDVALEQAQVTLDVAVEIPGPVGSTQIRQVQLPMFASTTGGTDVQRGHFAFRRPVKEDFPATVQPYIASSGETVARTLTVRSDELFDLIRFSVDLTTTPALEVTAQFPEPYVTGRLVFPPVGDADPVPVGDVNFFVERFIPASEDGLVAGFWDFVGGQRTFDAAGSDKGPGLSRSLLGAR